MNLFQSKRADSTSSNFAYTIIELVLALIVVTVLAGIVIFTLQSMLQDSTPRQAYNTINIMIPLLLDDIKQTNDSFVETIVPVTLTNSFYVTTENDNQVCLYNTDGNKRVRCEKHSDINIIEFSGGQLDTDKSNLKPGLRNIFIRISPHSDSYKVTITPQR